MLAITTARIRAAGLASGIAFEIIVVDDSSTKYQYGDSDANGAIIVRHRINRGYGSALATGIKHATYRWIGIVDADSTYPIESFREMLSLMPKYQMVIGARSWKDINWLRRVPKRVLTSLASFLACRKIPDLNSGMRVFDREIYERFPRIYPERFSFSSTLTMVSLTNAYDVCFLDIHYFQRRGKSSIHPIKDPIRFSYQLLRLSLYFRPLRFFIPLGLIVGALASGRGLRDLLVVQHFGGLTIMLFFMTFQIFLFGLIAEIINKK